MQLCARSIVQFVGLSVGTSDPYFHSPAHPPIVPTRPALRAPHPTSTSIAHAVRFFF